MPSLIFADLEKAKNNIMASQQQQIENLYKDWSAEVLKKAHQYSLKTTSSSYVSQKQMEQLASMLKATSQQVSNEIYGIVKGNIYTVADLTVKSNAKWLASFGFSEDGVNAAFSNVPDDVVRMLITGQIYDSGWSLSKRIWSDNESTMRDVYQIMAKGVAENKPIFEIAKELGSYVDPAAKKSWNPVLAMKNTKTGKIEYKRIYKSKVDYNTQRLARTLVQHGYQQSFIAVTKDNPFIIDYIWHSNGSRVCELCLARDGMHFKKDELPMDHPNGMCVMEPAIVSDMVDQLAEWFNSPDGTYPEIDAFASNFGYAAKPIKTVQDFLDKYGMSTKSPNAWFNSLTQIQKAEAKLLKEQSGLTWNDWYMKNVHAGSNTTTTTATQTVKAFSDVQDKYLSPYGFSPDNMPKNFDEWFNKLGYKQVKEIADDMGISVYDSKISEHLKKYYDANISSSNFVYKSAATKAAERATMPVSNVSSMANTVNKADTASWLASVKKQTESHMLDLEKNSMQLIGEAGKKGIEMYSGYSYDPMNGYLRLLQQGRSENDAIIASGITDRQLKAVKDAMRGLDKAKLTEDLILRRGTDLGDLAGAFMSGDFGTNKRSLYGKSAKELNDMFSGAVGTYGSFTSTSSIWDRGFPGDVEVVMYAPKGTSASSIMSISKFGTSEGETLLNAGTMVKCAKVEESDGHMGSKIRVFMEIIPKP